MLVNLHVVSTYPIHWSKYQVFRDYIQNFYDSVSNEEWKDRFKYNYANRVLTMSVEGVSFSYEWLSYIGASTKTLSRDKAGYFGEGFKMAALCSIRDHDYKVTMSSGKWKLQVVFQEAEIDNQPVKMLAYDVQEIEDTNKTVLTLENISSGDYKVFKTACESFFSAENQLIGPLIWENDAFALYLRSDVPMDPQLPYTYDFGRVGIVYCNHQLMGTNPFKLVVCCKKYEKEDRERKTLYDHEVISIFKELSQCIESEAAVVMLEHMKKCWRTSSQDVFDIHSWAVVISNLLSSISEDDEVARAFKQKYPDLLCLEPVYNMAMRNRRMQARNWLLSQKKHYVLVNESFRALGYYTVERMCEINGGFTVEDRPTEKDAKRFEIIEKLVLKIYKDFFMLDNKFPERKIIVNSRAVCHGMVKLNPQKNKIVNEDGLKIKDEPIEIYLKKDIFRQEGFYDALSTYIHEMCHMFGGDSSQNFSLALTLAMEKLLMNTEQVEKAHEEWQKVVN